MTPSLPSWICCQIGAREHYAIPRALHQQGWLAHLLTDAWVQPGSGWQRLPGPGIAGLRERYHPDLAQASIQAFTPGLVWFELRHRWRHLSCWEQIMARNHWFQQQALSALQQLAPHFTTPPILFSFSYAALELLRFAKQQGWRTVLDQIDPGRVEEDIVWAEHERHPHVESSWQPAPPAYWQHWQQECELADTIVVNSAWSEQALQQVGIPASKLQIVPLAYEGQPLAQPFTRRYPTTFTADRPLRVLFLGQIVLRKGIMPLLAAAEQLRQEPIDFWLVGPQGITLPPQFRHHPRLHWLGAVPRSATIQFYQQADVFLFPTLSDGFGLTQLEAQFWRLPLIASAFCGSVVREGENGLRLPEVTGTAIAECLRFCLHHPQQLQHFADHATPLTAFNLSHLQTQLVALAQGQP